MTEVPPARIGYTPREDRGTPRQESECCYTTSCGHEGGLSCVVLRLQCIFFSTCCTLQHDAVVILHFFTDEPKELSAAEKAAQEREESRRKAKEEKARREEEKKQAQEEKAKRDAERKAKAEADKKARE